MKKRRNPASLLLVLGGVVLILVLIGFWTAYTGARNEEQVVVATKNLSRYIPVQEGDLEFVGVPKGSITPENLTKEEYEQQFVNADKPLIPINKILAGQRVDANEVAEDAAESYSVVSPDEKVVAVTANFSAVTAVSPGDVIDVRQTSGGVGSDTGGSADFAKVLCVTDTTDGCKDLVPGSPQLSTPNDDTDVSSQERPVTLILAVSRDDAGALAGSAVNVVINPFCEVGADGTFVSVRTDQPCQIDASQQNRQAAQSAQANDAGGAGASDPAEEPNAPSVDPTNTTGDSQ